MFSKDFNVFSHLCFQKTTMSSFTFQRLQCLQSFTLSKDYNVFIYISKTSMSSIIYAFKRLQCLHLHFKGFNVFSHLLSQRLQCLHLHFKDFNVYIHLRFKRLQCLHLHFEDFNVFSHLYFWKTTMSSFTFQRLQYLQSFMLSKDYNVFFYILKTSISSIIYAFKRL